jgi:carboxyl-terminal processing protease
MNRARRHAPIATLLLWPTVALASPPPGDFEGLGREVVGIVREHFFDARRADDWADANENYAAGVADRGEFADLTNRKLAELKASHTRYYSPRDVEYHQLLSVMHEALGVADEAVPSIGVDLAPGNFVRTAFAGGEASRSGLRRGDRILEADGKPFDPVRSFASKGRLAAPVKLKVERRRGEPPLEIAVLPLPTKPTLEWRTAQREGRTIVRRNGKRVAYVPMFSCAGGDYARDLRAILDELANEADALVIDLRNGWGGCTPDFLAMFNPATPALTYIDRKGGRRVFSECWRKPLVLLVNGGSRSGKEVVAYAVKKHRLGTIVGERTAGAVLAGRAFLLSDRSLLYLAVADILVDGERLEGRGVEPDVAVPDRLPYADGSDPQLDRALAVAAGEDGGD